MQHYDREQGALVQVTDSQQHGAVRLSVAGMATPIGNSVWLTPEDAKLIGNELIAHALRVQADQAKRQIQMGRDDASIRF